MRDGEWRADPPEDPALARRAALARARGRARRGARRHAARVPLRRPLRRRARRRHRSGGARRLVPCRRRVRGRHGPRVRAAARARPGGGAAGAGRHAARPLDRRGRAARPVAHAAAERAGGPRRVRARGGGRGAGQRPLRPQGPAPRGRRPQPRARGDHPRRRLRVRQPRRRGRLHRRLRAVLPLAAVPGRLADGRRGRPPTTRRRTPARGATEAFARAYAAARGMQLEDRDAFRRRFDSPVPGTPSRSCAATAAGSSCGRTTAT